MRPATASWLSRPVRFVRRPAVADALLVAVVMVEALSTLSWAAPWEVAVAFASATGIVVRRRFPWVTMVMALPSMVLGLMTLLPLIALYSLAVRERRTWLLALAGSAMFIAVVQPWWGFGGIEPSFVALTFVYGVMNAATPIALGLLVRTRADLSMRLADLAALRESERQLIYAEVLTEERTRMAREMHDVVSHQVSLIAVQAGALQVRSHDDQTARASATIRSLAVRTLDELRQMVSVLRAGHDRQDGDAASEIDRLAPQPTVADIPALVAESHPGATVRIDLPHPLPAVYERALFRSVQEGLTNARKHAPGSEVSVVIGLRQQRIELEVSNTAATSAPMSLPSSGHGLIGLRERAQLLGGEVTVFQNAGEFALTVTLPRPVETGVAAVS